MSHLNCLFSCRYVALSPALHQTWPNPNSLCPDFKREQTASPHGHRPLKNLLMDEYVDLCCSLGLPAWIASLIHTAKRLRSDHARRRKLYRLLQRKLMFHQVGVTQGNLCQPTYVYPEEVKMLIRSVFPRDICDYPDPCHDQVVYITAEDLQKIEIN